MGMRGNVLIRIRRPALLLSGLKAAAQPATNQTACATDYCFAWRVLNH